MITLQIFLFVVVDVVVVYCLEDAARAPRTPADFQTSVARLFTSPCLSTRASRCCAVRADSQLPAPRDASGGAWSQPKDNKNRENEH